MKIFIINQKGIDHEILLDDEDYDKVLALHSECKFRVNERGYVWRQKQHGNRKNRVTTTLRLSRFIMDIGPDCPYQVDHIDRNKLNNQKSSLRLVTNNINSKNRNRPSASIFTGVSYKNDKGRQARWMVRVMEGRSSYFCGNFRDEREAAIAYVRAVIQRWDYRSWEAQSRIQHNLQILNMCVNEQGQLQEMRD